MRALVAVLLLGCTAPADPSPVSVVVEANDRFVVHEWGTFTSVSGSDGVFLEWRPLEGHDDLPSFVHRLGDVADPSAKFGVVATQRMETPVLYFYPGDVREVAVEVGFPRGIVTEWYPMATGVMPGALPPEGVPPSGGLLAWGRVALLPRTPERVAALPRETGDSHYYPARETDAAIVRACRTPGSDVGAELEGMLFYRGVGSFDTPLVATVGGDLATIGNDVRLGTPVPDAFAVEVRGGRARFARLGAIAPGETRHLALGPARGKDAVEAELSAALEASLARAGLYEAEARAMVETWRRTWLATEGLRVLYLLPQSFTDETLPLRMDPAPDEIVRVMLGRLEILTPWMRQDAAAIEADAGRDAVRSTFGRLTEPLLARDGP